MALVTKIFTGSDKRVRTVELRVARNGSIKTFLRPISETILLMPTED